MKTPERSIELPEVKAIVQFGTFPWHIPAIIGLSVE